ncbi:MAG: hypothetical protein ACM3TN_21910 [Alphaproteobacteria bacterium]
METKKFLLSAAVLAVVALAAAANVFAQSSCTSKTTSEGTGNFVVNVTQQTYLTNQGVRRTYTYTMTSPSGKNPNKFFVFVQPGLNGDLVGKNLTANSLGSYQTPDTFVGSNPPAAAWNVVHHEDGVGFTNVAINAAIQLDVSERYKPDQAVTTILLSISNTFEHCGPIFGPTTPEPPEFQGSPLVQTVSTKTFANGCIYDVVAGETDQNIISMTLNPNSPAFETVFSGPSPQPCSVTTVTLGTCEHDTGLVFCPVLKLGQPPIQSTAGGTCYYPTNIKFTC